MRTPHATPDGDRTDAVREHVRAAMAADTPFAILGGGTRSAWHAPVSGPGPALDMRTHCGVLRHEPSELVLTARSGTPLPEIEAVLADADQLLPFEPPRFGDATTLGGAVASGLAGPARPWQGSVRDAILGVALVDGRAELCRFGGEVMKNVAGYDISRLQAGAFGTLGVLLDVSLRVRARPQASCEQVLEIGMGDAIARMVALARRPWPITGLAWHAGALHVRLEGSAEGVAAAARAIGGDAGEEGDPAPGLFSVLRDRPWTLLDTGGAPASVWRLSVPVDAPQPALAANWVLDWGGSQRWCLTDADPERVLEAARVMGGHAQRIQPSVRRTPVAAPVARLEARVRAALDPQGLFNPGVLALDVRDADPAEQD